MEIVASYSSSDKDLYKKQLQDIMALYNIAKENVIGFFGQETIDILFTSEM